MNIKWALVLCSLPVVAYVCFIVHVNFGTQYGVQEESKLVPVPNDDVSNFDESECLLSNVVSDVNKTLTSIYNHVTSANVTVQNSTQESNETRKFVRCKDITYEDPDIEPDVEIDNGSILDDLIQAIPDITSRVTEADCVLAFIYSRACPFIAHAAPYYNALARAYPYFQMVAADVLLLKRNGINALDNIVGVSTLEMFHNGRPVGKFNGTEYNIQSFSELYAIIGQNPSLLLVTLTGVEGPNVENEYDYFSTLKESLILVFLYMVSALASCLYVKRTLQN